MTVRCDLTDLPVDQCAHCLKHGETPGEHGPWFRAAYRGFCSDLGELIEPGDMIRADGDGGYLCEECG